MDSVEGSKEERTKAPKSSRGRALWSAARAKPLTTRHRTGLSKRRTTGGHRAQQNLRPRSSPMTKPRAIAENANIRAAAGHVGRPPPSPISPADSARVTKRKSDAHAATTTRASKRRNSGQSGSPIRSVNPDAAVGDTLSSPPGRRSRAGYAKTTPSQAKRSNTAEEPSTPPLLNRENNLDSVATPPRTARREPITPINVDQGPTASTQSPRFQSRSGHRSSPLRDAFVHQRVSGRSKTPLRSTRSILSTATQGGSHDIQPGQEIYLLVGDDIVATGKLQYPTEEGERYRTTLHGYPLVGATGSKLVSVYSVVSKPGKGLQKYPYTYKGISDVPRTIDDMAGGFHAWDLLCMKPASTSRSMVKPVSIPHQPAFAVAQYDIDDVNNYISESDNDESPEDSDSDEDYVLEDFGKRLATRPRQGTKHTGPLPDTVRNKSGP